MKIELLCSELKKYNAIIKNNNELYIEVSEKNVVETAGLLLSMYKLNFAGEFCSEMDGFVVNVVFTSRKNGYYVTARYKAERIVSLQNIIYQANLFEREMADLYGLEIQGGADNRNLVKHEVWEKEVFPLRKEFSHGRKIKEKYEIEEYGFKCLSGEGGYQIAVGPVHAGIIEPGHFRFSVIGEQIENLEIRLMYKHKGIEKTMENIDANKLNLIFERVSGESTAAYSESYALLIEKLNSFEVSPNIKALRVILLELERICNFLEDIAGICTDVGYSYPAKKFSYFTEVIRQLCERVTGSRFLRNSIIPMGNNVHFNKVKAVDIVNTINGIVDRFDKIVEITCSSVSFLDRVEHTGILRNSKAAKLCSTGVSARASGVSYDVRNSFSYEIYKTVKKPLNIETIGGVYERYILKIQEIRQSFECIKSALSLIQGEVPRERKRIEVLEGSEALASVETTKGELIVYGLVGKDNKFSRIYLKTPSFANWKGLTYSVLNEIVPDFPLCNKSFNMSYSENDR
ncbi:MAG: NADH-quinone oxidoreductase subunit C [Solirubrobacterales bacterium]